MDIPASSRIEKLAGGFTFTEGPIWTRSGDLLFSDIPENTIYRWVPATGAVEVFRKPSGFDGAEWPAGALPGSNGLSLDHEGRLLVCEHGNRRVTRIEADGSLTALADRFEGKRLNSPNDIVQHTSGAIYFTDPPYGLMGRDGDPAKELPFSGVYRLADGGLQLLHDGLSRPNGLAFSPDEKVLYLANSDAARRVWMRFDVAADGSLRNGEVFFDATTLPEVGLPDGMKVDVEGNLYCTGPGGVMVFTPDARHIGTIRVPEQPANLHWGDADAKALYITAVTGLYRLRMEVAGIRP